jgi:selT/selW/selH-like putative selenoprotein
VINDIKLVTSRGGAFEVTVNDQLIFSKKSMQRRHAEPGEILGMLKEIVGPDVPIFE